MVDHSGDPERKNPAYLGESNNAAPAYLHHEGKATMQDSYLSDSASESNSFPTEEEMLTLKRVPAPIPWRIYTIAFVELVERMSYYGCVQVYSNFIAKKRPTPTGMALHPNDANAQPGALGMGKQIAFSLTTFNSFWVYVTPFLGAWIADTYLGRFNTILIAVVIAEIGHVILTASAAPSVLDKPNTALGIFVLGIIVMGLGTGMFKPNISPLIAEQVPLEKMRVETVKGERVIVDPAVTIVRVYNYFYMYAIPPRIDSPHKLITSQVHQHRCLDWANRHGLRRALRRLLSVLLDPNCHVHLLPSRFVLVQEVLHSGPSRRQRRRPRLQAPLQGRGQGRQHQPVEVVEELARRLFLALGQAFDPRGQQAVVVQLR
jgi:hypothetical protein